MAGGGRLELSNNITVTGEIAEIQGNGGDNTTGGVIRNVSGSNTWTGNVITVGNDSRLIAADGTLTISGVISSNNVGNNQVIFRGQGGTIELTNANSYGGTTRVFGTASNAATVPMLRLSGGNNRLPTGTSIDIGGGGVSGSMEIAGVSQEVAGLVSNGGATTSKISGTGTATLVVNNSVAGTFTGTLTDSLAFTKAGAASYTLSGNNNYSRGTTINGGTLKVAHAAALGIGTVNLNAGSGAVLQLATDTSVNAYNLTMGSNRFNTIVSDKASLSTAGIVHALGTLSIGASTLTINKGANATGTTAGVSFTSVDLSAGNNERNVTFNGDGVISLGAVAALSNNVGFAGGAGNGGTVAAKVLQLDGTNASNTVTGVISNTNNTGSTVVSLVKANNSIWTLQSDNTYTGDTTIKAGTLVLGAAGTIANSPKIIVGDTGSTTAVLDVSAKTSGFTVGGAQTLSGIGKLDADAGGTLRDITIQGTHAPGNSAGIQTVEGNLSYAAGSIFEWELNANTVTQGASSSPTFDQVAVANGGTLAISKDAKFRIILNSSGSDVDFTQGFWSTNQSWNIFTGASALTGFKLDSVSADRNGVAFAANHPNGSFSITGSTLTWTAVPEASSALIGLLVGAGLLRRRRGC
jgi:autotransporter-associated beta strand protein